MKIVEFFFRVIFLAYYNWAIIYLCSQAKSSHAESIFKLIVASELMVNASINYELNLSL